MIHCRVELNQIVLVVAFHLYAAKLGIPLRGRLRTITVKIVLRRLSHQVGMRARLVNSRDSGRHKNLLILGGLEVEMANISRSQPTIFLGGN